MVVALPMKGRDRRSDSLWDQEIFLSYFHFLSLLLCLFVQLETNQYINLAWATSQFIAIKSIASYTIG